MACIAVRVASESVAAEAESLVALCSAFLEAPRINTQQPWHAERELRVVFEVSSGRIVAERRSSFRLERNRAESSRMEREDPDFYAYQVAQHLKDALASAKSAAGFIFIENVFGAAEIKAVKAALGKKPLFLLTLHSPESAGSASSGAEGGEDEATECLNFILEGKPIPTRLNVVSEIQDRLGE